MDSDPDDQAEAHQSAHSPAAPSDAEAAPPPASEGVPAAGTSPDGAPRGPRRRRRRRRGPPRQAPADAPRLGSALEAGGPAPAGEGENGEVQGGDDAARPILKLRNVPRGRRRLAHPPGLRSGAADAAQTGGASAEASAEAPAEGAVAAEGEASQQSERPPRRRRRRRRPRSETPTGTAEAASGEAGAAAPATDRPPRRDWFGRNRRPRREGEAPQEGRGGADGAAGQRERREAGPRNGAGRGPGGERRERGGDQRGRRGGPGDRRGRGAPERKVERKLYSVDAVVDRGFEDVEQEGETRRVHWTIVKRTVADQVSRKPVSASYVLQRDGNDAEFPSLGAARDAVNKTIVHPEKLTASKSEIAALKGSSR